MSKKNFDAASAIDRLSYVDESNFADGISDAIEQIRLAAAKIAEQAKRIDLLDKWHSTPVISGMLKDRLESLLHIIQGSRTGTIGPHGSHYLPQLSVQYVNEIRQQLRQLEQQSKDSSLSEREAKLIGDLCAHRVELNRLAEFFQEREQVEIPDGVIVVDWIIELVLAEDENIDRQRKLAKGYYEDLAASFYGCPSTYLPALLITLVEACIKRKIFFPGRIPHVVNAALEGIEAEGATT